MLQCLCTISLNTEKIIQRHLVLYGIITKIFRLILKEIQNLLYTTSITGKTANNGNTKEVEFSVPLKHLSNFWSTLDIPLINCEVSLTLTWSKTCVLTDMKTTAPGAQGDPPAIEAPTGATFSITNAKR